MNNMDSAMMGAQGVWAMSAATTARQWAIPTGLQLLHHNGGHPNTGHKNYNLDNFMAIKSWATKDRQGSRSGRGK